MTDLATLHLQVFGRDSTAFGSLEAGLSLLERAERLDARNPNIFLKRSLAEYYRHRYAEAWAYLHRARSLDVSSLDFTYIRQLQSRQPDPTGFFRQN